MLCASFPSWRSSGSFRSADTVPEPGGDSSAFRPERASPAASRPITETSKPTALDRIYRTTRRPQAPERAASSELGEGEQEEEPKDEDRLRIGFNVNGGVGSGGSFGGPALGGTFRISWQLNRLMGMYGQFSFVGWVASTDKTRSTSEASPARRRGVASASRSTSTSTRRSPRAAPSRSTRSASRGLVLTPTTRDHENPRLISHAQPKSTALKRFVAWCEGARYTLVSNHGVGGRDPNVCGAAPGDRAFAEASVRPGGRASASRPTRASRASVE
jgi:hypothetical protein